MTIAEEAPPAGATTAAATRTALRTCPLCEAGCGLEITLRPTADGGEQVARIRGDQADVFSRGYICPKGSTLKQLHEDPDRVRTPLIKRDGVFVEASWDDAFAEIEARLLPVLEQHGRDACAVYLGNPSAHSLAGLLYGRAVLRALGSTNVYSASTVDQRPKEISAALMFGGGLTVPVPDVDRTDHLLMLGANPFASNGSLATDPTGPAAWSASSSGVGSLSSTRDAPGRPRWRASGWRSGPAPTPTSSPPWSRCSPRRGSWTSARSPSSSPGPFVLIGRRQLRSNNSWMHNIRVLVKGTPRCTMHVHPDDAAALGLAEGDQAVVRSRVGEVTVPVEVTDAIRPGVVSIPHGWGHDLAGAQMSVAAAHAGLNSNLLADETLFDPISGNAVLNGIPVQVSPAG